MATNNNNNDFMFMSSMSNGDIYQHSQYSPPPHHHASFTRPNFHSDEEYHLETLASNTVTEISNLPPYHLNEEVHDPDYAEMYPVVVNETSDILSQSMSIALGGGNSPTTGQYNNEVANFQQFGFDNCWTNNNNNNKHDMEYDNNNG